MGFVNNSIPHCRRLDLQKYIDNDVEGMVIECQLGKNKWLIAALYKPPCVSDANFKKCFLSLSEELLTITTRVMILGDLNCDMNKSNKLNDMCGIMGLKNIVVGNTCFKSISNPTAIDVILVSSKLAIAESLNTDIGISDCHNVVGCAMKAFRPNRMKKEIYYRSFR
mgnify:CR=1 FL=1